MKSLLFIMEIRINRDLIKGAGYKLVESTSRRFRKLEIYEGGNYGLIYDEKDKRVVHTYLKNSSGDEEKSSLLGKIGAVRKI